MFSCKLLESTFITINMDDKTKSPEIPQRSGVNRRCNLPVLHTRGSHYDVGYDIGRTFKSLIQQYTDELNVLNQEYLPAYKTAKGREAYEETLKAVKITYPNYIRELEGTADGAQVPFYILFLMHMDDIILKASQDRSTNIGQGCSTVTLNKGDQVIIAHNEDALREAMNNVYIVHACITDEEPHEEFTAFCYAGILPGYAMAYNKHLAFTINIIQAKYLPSGKIPRTFITRALISATSIEDVERISRYNGGGAADAFSLNLAMLQKDGAPILYNIEVAPSYPPSGESAYKAIRVKPGDNFFHCNKFLYLNNVPEEQGRCVDSSNSRHETKERLPEPKNLQHVVNILGDTSRTEGVNIYRNQIDEKVLTLATGVFDFTKKQFSVYMDNPKLTEPLTVFPLYPAE